MSRPLEPRERALLDFLLTRDFPGAAELRSQAHSVRTSGLTCTCSCPSFSLHADRSLAPAAVTESMPSDAYGTDPDGNLIGVLLVVEAGYLSDGEIYGIEGDVSGALPAPVNLRLSEWSSPDDSETHRLLNP